MRLVKAEISGFGRLASVKVNLDHKVVAIVGPNEAGKTTLLRALAYIDNEEMLDSAQRSRGIPGGIADDHEVVKVQYLLGDSDLELLKKFDLEEKPRELWYSRVASGGAIIKTVVPEPRKSLAGLEGAIARLLGGKDFLHEVMQNGDPESGDLSSEIALLANSLKKLEESPRAELRSIVGLMDTLELIASAEGLGFPETFLEPLRDIHEWIMRPDPAPLVAQALYDISPDILLFSEEDRNLRASYELSDQQVSNPVASLANIASMAALSLELLWQAVQSGDDGASETLIEKANSVLRKKFLQAWNQSRVSVHLKINGASIEVRIKQGESTITRFSERSAGVQMFVAVVAFLNAKGQVAPPVLLIDEAETHLHLNAQADLVNEFMTQTQASKIIYTTHSPACLPPDLGTNIRAVVPQEDNDAVSRVQASFWTEGIGYSPLMLAMGAGAAAFSSARKVVLAEGATEMILLPSLIKNAIGVDDLEYQIAPGLSEAPLALYPELDLVGSRVAFLVDGDSGGRELKRKLIKANFPPASVVELGALTLEDLVDPVLYKEAVVSLLNEQGGIAAVTQGIPDPIGHGEKSWYEAISKWSRERGLKLPSKRVIASRLVEEGNAVASVAGASILVRLHTSLTEVLSKNPHPR